MLMSNFMKAIIQLNSDQPNKAKSPVWHDKLITKKPSTQTNIHNPENWQSLTLLIHNWPTG